MTAESIDFWFSMGSAHSYLTVMRLPELARQSGIAFRWRPFSVRALMQEQNNSPFHGKPARIAYMWRDIERRAALHGLPVSLPAPWPLQALDLANRVAVLGAREGWCAAYVRASYRRWFQRGQEPGMEPNLSDSLREICQDPARVRIAAGEERTGEAYRAATDEARALGLFGAPSFVVGREVFWGDDRLEDAIAWARQGTLAPA